MIGRYRDESAMNLPNCISGRFVLSWERGQKGPPPPGFGVLVPLFSFLVPVWLR